MSTEPDEPVDAAVAAVLTYPKAVDAAPVGSVIALLEETLAEAREGDVIAIGIAYVRPGGVVGKGHAGPPRPMPFHNDLAAATLDLQHSLAEERARAYDQPAPAVAGEA